MVRVAPFFLTHGVYLPLRLLPLPLSQDVYNSWKSTGILIPPGNTGNFLELGLLFLEIL